MRIYAGMTWGWVVMWIDDYGHVHTRKFETRGEAYEFKDQYHTEEQN